jgi:hypothetical protein
MNWFMAWALVFTGLGFFSMAVSSVAFRAIELDRDPYDKQTDRAVDKIGFCCAILFHLTALAFAFYA